MDNRGGEVGEVEEVGEVLVSFCLLNLDMNFHPLQKQNRGLYPKCNEDKFPH